MMMIVLGTVACSVGHLPPEIEEGRTFAVSRCSDVRVGAGAKEVETLLGEPLSVERSDQSEIWDYFMRVREVEERRFLGLVPMPDATHYWSRRATVKLEQGVVVGVTCPVSRDE